MRADQPIERTPVLYEPSIIIVCQGRKRGYLADRIWHYDAQQFLVLSVPLPFSSETEATPEEPMLAVAVKLNLALATELLPVKRAHAGGKSRNERAAFSYSFQGDYPHIADTVH